MIVVIAGNREQAVQYCRDHGLRTRGPDKAWIVSSPRTAEGIRPTQVHWVGSYAYRSDAVHLIQVMLAASLKMRNGVIWFKNGRVTTAENI